MREGKPFFFRIDSSRFLAEVMAIKSDKECGKFIKQFALELVTGIVTLSYAKDVFAEAVEYIDKKKYAGSAGGKAKASNAIAVLEHTPSIPLARSSNRSRSSTEAEALKSLDAGRVQDKPSRAARSKKLSDEEMMQQIRLSPIYQRIDVDGEYIKMKLWCQNKGKIPTMSRVDFLDSFVGVVNQAQ